MGPPENPTSHGEKQGARRRRGPARRARGAPRARCCLLKGCEQRFRPRHARQRYCSEGCREAARRWSRWKAQQRYRATAAGQQKRNGQSQRYRERVKDRRPPESEPVNEAARLITKDFFSMAAATGRAATRDSRAGGEVPCNASVRTPAGAPWSACTNGSGAGGERAS